MDDTIVPRLRRAGADLTMVKLVPHGASTGQALRLPPTSAGLAKEIVELGAKIVVFDPLSAFMGEKTDTHNDASVRRALQPLRGLAMLTGAAVLVVRHLTKGGVGKALYRGGGSHRLHRRGAGRVPGRRVPRRPGHEAVRLREEQPGPKPPTLTYRIEVDRRGALHRVGRGVGSGAQAILDGPERQNVPRRRRGFGAANGAQESV